MISDSASVLFVHVQKTGGSSIDNWLRASLPDVRTLPDRDRHAGLRTILKDEPDLRSYFVFGFVRNPWSRMLSWHRMIRRWVEEVPAGEPLESLRSFQVNPFARRVALELPDFESFVMRGPGEFPRLRRPQIAYLEAPRRRADLIGRQERFEADLEVVRERLGLPAREERRYNADVVDVDYREHYSTAMRERVGELFARDVEEFGYEF